MSQQAFFFDGTRCSGCKTCMFACKDAYDLDVGTAYRRVLEYTGGDTVRNGDGTFGSTCFSYNVSVACNHCDDPVCVRVCPTEVFCAVVFLALAGLYWLYNFVEHPKPQLQRAWLVLAMLAGAVFVAAVGCAYAADTIVSWHTVYVPLNLMLNALVGGPILAIAGLRAAGYEPVEGRMGRVLTMVAAAALAVNVVTFGVQGADLASIENSYLTAAELVPSYGLMVCAFGVLGMAGIGLDAVELWPRRVRLSVGRAAGAAVLVLAGIFVMRFAFYMMHMTVGLGV